MTEVSSHERGRGSFLLFCGQASPLHSYAHTLWDLNKPLVLRIAVRPVTCASNVYCYECEWFLI